MRPLTRDYWPEGVRNPYLRMTLGLLLGPVLTIGLIGGALWLADRMIKGESALSWPELSPLIYALLIYAYIVMSTIGLAAILLLWTLRARSWWVFAMTGAATGLVAALAYGLLTRQSTAIAPLMIVSLIGVLMFLCYRALAGVRVQ